VIPAKVNAGISNTCDSGMKTVNSYFAAAVQLTLISFSLTQLARASHVCVCGGEMGGWVCLCGGGCWVGVGGCASVCEISSLTKKNFTYLDASVSITVVSLLH
jgi:hypothetical protein